jgi:methylthioribose-1-phosphate isomerase
MTKNTVDYTTLPLPYRAIEWVGDSQGHLRLLDQTRLPNETVYLDCQKVEQVFDAIRALSVRGAPAIGVSAAYGLVLSLRACVTGSGSNYIEEMNKQADYLATSRPTAVNLFWALERMRKVGMSVKGSTAAEIHARLFQEAMEIEREDFAMCKAMGTNGAALLKDCTGVLTHCNTGALATAGQGTAFSMILEASRQYGKLRVYADETRPLLQGARLTTWEFQQHDVPVTLICDSMAAWVMKQKLVQAVVVGADRIAANGDSANKIGTYSLALLAQRHHIPFYIVAPSSTFDLSLAHGDLIPIEERHPDEILRPRGAQFATSNTEVYNPAFDVAPATDITAIVTEKGVIQPVTTAKIQAMIG